MSNEPKALERHHTTLPRWGLAPEEDKYGEQLHTSIYKILNISINFDGKWVPLQNLQEQRNLHGELQQVNNCFWQALQGGRHVKATTITSISKIPQIR